MDPLTFGLMTAAGLAFQGGGMFESFMGGNKANAAQIQMIEAERKQEALRRQAMELNARRQQMEVLRNQQRKRSIAQANASGQGAQFGSGLQGGFGQIAGAAGNNSLAIGQNLELGRSNFDLNSQISNYKIDYANAQRQQQFGQGLTSFGGSIMGAAQSGAKLATNFQTSPGSSWYGGYNESKDW